jgi:lysine 2,3-aminomutase
VTKGIEIIEGLRGHISGIAVPTFVVDAPGGGGKIPVMPNYIISQAPGKTILRNYEGMITTYYGPTSYDNACECEDCLAAKEGKFDPYIKSDIRLDQYNSIRKRKAHK